MNKLHFKKYKIYHISVQNVCMYAYASMYVCIVCHCFGFTNNFVGNLYFKHVLCLFKVVNFVVLSQLGVLDMNYPQYSAETR